MLGKRSRKTEGVLETKDVGKTARKKRKTRVRVCELTSGVCGAVTQTMCVDITDSCGSQL